MFLHGSSTPQSSWTVIGTGIRLAQDVGAHRRKVYNNNKRTVEDELWKRAFWYVLPTYTPYSTSSHHTFQGLDLHGPVYQFCTGTAVCHSRRRVRFCQPVSMQCLLNFYYSFDLEMPIECDDEYWVTSDPDMAFKQPAGKPSTVTFFNCLLRLNQILAFALRTIVSGICSFCHGELSNKAFL